MYDLITVNAGHSASSPGASGNGYKEHEVARLINNQLIRKFKALGQRVIDTTSDAKTSSAVLKEQVNKANQHNARSKLNLSIHLNAGGGTGTEVLYIGMASMAKVLSQEISKVAKWRDRGAKQREDLYFLRNTKGGSLLIEVCFIDNADDMTILINKMDAITDKIAETVTGKKINRHVESSKMFTVQVGAFIKEEYARELVKELKEKGYNPMIK